MLFVYIPAATVGALVLLGLCLLTYCCVQGRSCKCCCRSSLKSGRKKATQESDKEPDLERPGSNIIKAKQCEPVNPNPATRARAIAPRTPSALDGYGVSAGAPQKNALTGGLTEEEYYNVGRLWEEFRHEDPKEVGASRVQGKRDYRRQEMHTREDGTVVVTQARLQKQKGQHEDIDASVDPSQQPSSTTVEKVKDPPPFRNPLEIPIVPPDKAIGLQAPDTMSHKVTANAAGGAGSKVEKADGSVLSRDTTYPPTQQLPQCKEGMPAEKSSWRKRLSGKNWRISQANEKGHPPQQHGTDGHLAATAGPQHATGDVNVLVIDAVQRLANRLSELEKRPAEVKQPAPKPEVAEVLGKLALSIAEMEQRLSGNASQEPQKDQDVALSVEQLVARVQQLEAAGAQPQHANHMKVVEVQQGPAEQEHQGMKSKSKEAALTYEPNDKRRNKSKTVTSAAKTSKETSDSDVPEGPPSDQKRKKASSRRGQQRRQLNNEPRNLDTNEQGPAVDALMDRIHALESKNAADAASAGKLEELKSRIRELEASGRKASFSSNGVGAANEPAPLIPGPAEIPTPPIPGPAEHRNHPVPDLAENAEKENGAADPNSPVRDLAGKVEACAENPKAIPHGNKSRVLQSIASRGAKLAQNVRWPRREQPISESAGEASDQEPYCPEGGTVVHPEEAAGSNQRRSLQQLKKVGGRFASKLRWPRRDIKEASDQELTTDDVSEKGQKVSEAADAEVSAVPHAEPGGITSEFEVCAKVGSNEVPAKSGSSCSKPVPITAAQLPEHIVLTPRRVGELLQSLGVATSLPKDLKDSTPEDNRSDHIQSCEELQKPCSTSGALALPLSKLEESPMPPTELPPVPRRDKWQSPCVGLVSSNEVEENALHGRLGLAASCESCSEPEAEDAGDPRTDVTAKEDEELKYEMMHVET